MLIAMKEMERMARPTMTGSRSSCREKEVMRVRVERVWCWRAGGR